jgi:hypothetical protein
MTQPTADTILDTLAELRAREQAAREQLRLTIGYQTQFRTQLDDCVRDLENHVRTNFAAVIDLTSYRDHSRGTLKDWYQTQANMDQNDRYLLQMLDQLDLVSQAIATVAETGQVRAYTDPAMPVEPKPTGLYARLFKSAPTDLA